MPFNWFGYVYLLQCGDQFKIGYSKMPLKRVRQFRTGSPVPVWLIHKVRTVFYREIERQLHHRFADKRTRGEWFKLDGPDVEYIRSLNSKGRTPAEQQEWDSNK